MKKSLSVLLASAMVSSMFSSIAFAADLDTQAKHQELVKLNIFDADGTGKGAELDAKMTREQYAKVLARLKGLNEIPGATPYNDVAADRWSAGFINAVSKANPFLMDGKAPGVFDPEGNVTFQELATIAVRALNLQVDSSATVSGKVDDWAKGFVATAIKAGLIPEKSDYTADALRSDLVETTYEAKQALDAQTKVSVTEAKAVGVQKVQVSFNKAVDTEKATFTLKKGATTITLDTAATKWSDDKKTATLTLKDTKISAGDYTVTLGGIDAAEIATASASFKAENETVTKIEFVSASEEIAKAPKVTLKIKPVNQYGEVASFPAGSYTQFISVPNVTVKSFTKGDDGLLALALDTSSSSLSTGIGVVPITVYHNDTRVTANKTFKVGTEAYVAKVEVSDPTYSNDKKALTTTDDKATVKLTMYDQYGGVFTVDSIFSDNRNRPNIQTLITPYEPNFATPVVGTNLDQIELQLAKNVEKNAEYTLTVYAGISSATTKVTVQSTKVANKVEFAEFTGTLAAGDTNKYLVINAYDAEGNKLSADDIVANAESGRFAISINGATLASGSDIVTVTGSGTNTGIVRYGEHKGKLKLASITSPAKGIVYANLGIYTANVQNNATLSIPVADARIPTYLSVDTEPAPKAVLGADSKFKFLVKDQYGEKLDSVATTQFAASDFELTVTVTGTTYGDLKTQATGNAVVPSGTTYNATGFAAFNSGFIFDTNGTIGKMEFEAKLVDKRGGTTRDITSVKRSIETIDPKTNLTYTISPITDVFAALDSSLTPAADKPASGGNAFTSKLAKAISITAKDGAGNKVEIPAGRIVGVQSSNPTVVTAVYGGSNEGKVIGNKAGTATITVAFKSAKDEVLTQTIDVTSKADAVVVATLTANAAKATSAVTPVTGTTNVYDAYALLNLKVKDNYGIEFTTTDIAKYNNFFGILYSVSDVKLKGAATNSAADKVTIDQTTGQVTVGSNVAEFILKAVSNNGKVVSTIVTN